MTNMALQRRILGATIDDANTTWFGAYVTAAETCAVRLFTPDGQVIATHAMDTDGEGYFGAVVPGVGHGALYKLVVGERELPDPYARFLPQGVHGPAMVVEPRYQWQHDPAAGVRPLSEHVIYELHVGTFTPEGTYEAARARLPYLAELGVTAVELMPVSASPGTRGWGYDGVAHFASFAPYGEPDALRRFVDEAHGLGLSVLLDVVYNHFGPSGQYLSSFSPEYFTRAVQTPWGDAPDFTHPVMRRFVVDNALYWLREMRFDGLRLDAIHAIHDPTPRHILQELAETVATVEPRKLLIAEDDRNDPECITRLGCDAVWADDFHHQMRATLTGERDGYYAAYTPGAAGVAQAIRQGWLYEGQPYSPWGKERGASARDLPAPAFVYCIQNHDQIGNRAFGNRLSEDVSLDAVGMASVLLLFLPATPLLFMGQEWGATTPFLFFTDHDPELGKLVSAGRRHEFASFEAFSDPARRKQIPDPQAPATFVRSRLDWGEQARAPHARMLELYRQLLALRRSDPVLRQAGRQELDAEAQGELLLVQRRFHDEQRVLLVNFAAAGVPTDRLPLDRSRARMLVESRPGCWDQAALGGHAAVVLATPRTAG